MTLFLFPFERAAGFVTAVDLLRHGLGSLAVPLREPARHPLSNGLDTGLQVDPSNPAVMAQIEKVCAARELDWSIQQESTWKVLAMDMDSTVITIECIDEIADFAGRKAEVAAITEATMRGEIKSFEESVRRRVAMLEGVTVADLEAVKTARLRFSPGAPELLKAAGEAGLHRLLVSGGFTYFADHVAKSIGFDEVHANVLDIVEGRLTGRLVGPVVDGEAKRQALLGACSTLGVSADQAIAVGDGSNDLPMMSEAGLSVAYHAKPAVREKAQQRIDHVGLESLISQLPDSRR